MRKLLLVGSALLIIAAGLQAQPCTNASISGAYSYGINGSLFSNGGTTLAGFYSTVGVVTSDGKGSLSGISFGSANGVQSPSISWTGAYSVSANCLGTMSVTSQGTVTNYVIAIAANGNQISFLCSTPAVVASGTATRQTIASPLAMFPR